MSITDRDKKIVMAIIPIALILAYWFLVLTPKRDEAQKAGQALTEQRKKADDLEAQASRLEAAKATFAQDYRDVVRLGKAIPSSVDMPSLIVQLDQAARGTGIKFSRIKTGERALASSSQSSATGSGNAGNGTASGSGSNGSTPAAGGSGAPQAQSGSGKIVQNANNSADAASQKSADKEKTGDDLNTQTATSSKPGGLPVGGGATPGGASAGASSVPGLDSIPLEFKFDGSFFDLADFFHRLKRFVRVTNKDVLVRGRLMTIDSMKYTSEPTTFPDLSVELKATVYLSPKSEGASAGATAQGPSTNQSAAASSEGSGSPAAGATPTATATP